MRRTKSRRPVVFTVLLALLIGLFQSPLLARENVNTNRFRPIFNSKGLMLTEAGDLMSHLTWMVGLVGHYGYKPLVLVDASSGDELRTLISHRTTADLVLSLGLYDWVELGLDLPLIISQDGYQPGDQTRSVQKFTVGDLRFAVKVAFLRSFKDNVALSFQLTSTIPTAPSNNTVGEKGVALTPQLNFSYSERIFVGFNLGATFRTSPQSTAGVRFSHELNANLGLGYTFRSINLTLFTEATISAALSRRIFQRKEETPAEWLLGMRLQLGQIHILAGGGLGVIRGVGVPTATAFLGLAWSTDINDRDRDGIPDGRDFCINTPEDKDGFEDHDGCPDADNDKDGICDPWVAQKGLSAQYRDLCRGSDKCPMEKEDRDGFQDSDGCPDLDNDGDGIPDERDLCPNEPEDKDGFQDSDGCPDLDNDGDGVPEPRDRCPNEPEDHDGYQDSDGCPDPDNDNDGIPDVRDRCPFQPETFNKFNDEDGCPDALAELRKKEIKVHSRIFFEVARSYIRPRSYPVLNEVAKILRANPDILLLEIGGHSDSLGNRRYNRHLSFFRAKAVFNYLTQIRKISKKRLRYKGYGYDVPLIPGRDKKALAKNRRVEFKILRRKP